MARPFTSAPTEKGQASLSSSEVPGGLRSPAAPSPLPRSPMPELVEMSSDQLVDRLQRAMWALGESSSEWPGPQAGLSSSRHLPNSTDTDTDSDTSSSARLDERAKYGWQPRHHHQQQQQQLGTTDDTAAPTRNSFGAAATTAAVTTTTAANANANATRTATTQHFHGPRRSSPIAGPHLTPGQPDQGDDDGVGPSHPSPARLGNINQRHHHHHHPHPHHPHLASPHAQHNSTSRNNNNNNSTNNEHRMPATLSLDYLQPHQEATSHPHSSHQAQVAGPRSDTVNSAWQNSHYQQHCIQTPKPHDQLVADHRGQRLHTNPPPSSHHATKPPATLHHATFAASHRLPYPHLPNLASVAAPADLPLLILDLRPLQSFLDLRIAGSINLALPSLVIRRMRRSANPVSTRDAPLIKAAASTISPLAHLATYITTTGGKRKFQHILDCLAPSHPPSALQTQPCSKSIKRGLSFSTSTPREAPRLPAAESPSAGMLASPSPLDLWKADVIIVCSEPSSVRGDESRSFHANASASASAPAHASAASSFEASQALSSALANLPQPVGEEGTRRGSVFLFNEGMRPIAEHPEAADWMATGPDGDGEDFDSGVASPNLNAPQEATASGALSGLSTLSLLSPLRNAQNARNDVHTLPVLSTPSSGSSSATGFMHSAPVSAASSSASNRAVGSPLNPSAPPVKKPGRPSLARLDTSEKVKTLGASGYVHRSATEVAVPALMPALKIDVSKAQPLRPATAVATPISPAGAAAAATTTTTTTAASHLSLQTLAHLQAQMPPSPATFSDMSLALPSVASPTTFSQSPWTRAQADRELARRGSVPLNRLRSDSETALALSYADSLATSPGHGNSYSASSSSSPNSEYYQASPMRCLDYPEAPVFDVSTIIPSFLFLGPDITTLEEAEELQRKGVKRILNCAAEVSDKSSSVVPPDALPGSDQSAANHFCLADRFEKYMKIPMWDNVEAKGVQGHISQACAFLDDARLHDSPVYVHCRAGKSRSVSIVIAYLIHAHRWTLKKSYAYVVERRADVSPNIGFVSCLMAFEDMTLNRTGQTAFLGGKGGSERDHEAPAKVNGQDHAPSGANGSANHSSDKGHSASGGDDGFMMPRQIRQSMPSIGALFTPQAHNRSVSPLSKAPVTGDEDDSPLDAESPPVAGSSLVAPQHCKHAAEPPNGSQHATGSDGAGAARLSVRPQRDAPAELENGGGRWRPFYNVCDAATPPPDGRSPGADVNHGRDISPLTFDAAMNATPLGFGDTHQMQMQMHTQMQHSPTSTTEDTEPAAWGTPKRRKEPLISPPQHTLPDAFASGAYDMEQRGYDGRYRNFRRGPVKEESHAPGRRATMAGLGKESGGGVGLDVFARNLPAANSDEGGEERAD